MCMCAGLMECVSFNIILLRYIYIDTHRYACAYTHMYLLTSQRVDDKHIHQKRKTSKTKQTFHSYPSYPTPKIKYITILQSNKHPYP